MLGMIHGEAGEPNFWAMARYGQAHGDDALCRHVILATLGEADSSMGMTLLNLQNKCTTTTPRQIGAHCQTVARVVNEMNMDGEDGTINQVVTKWRSKPDDGTFDFLKENPPANDLSKEDCERVIIYLLLEDVLHPKIVFTAYSTIVYLILGPKGPNLLSSPNPRAEIGFPIKPKRKQSLSSRNPVARNPVAATDEGGWMSARSQATKARAAKAKASKAAGKSKRKSTKPARGGRNGAKRKTAKSKTPMVVEINSSSSSSEDEDLSLARRRDNLRKKRQRTVIADSDSDFELSD